MLKIGIAEWCLPVKGKDAICLASNLGLEAIHLGFPISYLQDFSEAESSLRLCREEVDRLGILIAAVAMNPLETLGGIKNSHLHQGEACRDLIRQGIDVAMALRIPMVYVPSFGLMEICSDLELQNTADLLNEMSAYAIDKGVLLASENSLGSRDSVELQRKVSRQNFRFLLDTLNPVHWGHDAAETASAVRPFLCDQIHVKDCSDSASSVPLGLGIGKFKETAESLAALDFQGVVIIENKYDTSLKENIALDIVTIKRCFALASNDAAPAGSPHAATIGDSSS
jgi:sugar phosphate isomerase/epimerase